MGPTTLLLADATGEAAQIELREQNPFALRSTATSTATLPPQGQAALSAEGDSPLVADRLLRDRRRAKQVVV